MVRTKRTTWLKAHTAIETLRSNKVRVTAGFEEKFLISPAPGHIKDVGK